MLNNSVLLVLTGGGRQSNIESLRLLCMLMVLNLHSFWGYDHGSGVLQFSDFFRESTSVCAVDTFLLISGYFGIKWKFKSFFNLIFQILFYGYGVYIVAGALGFIDFSVSGLFGITKRLYALWGFATGYVCLYVCAPLLNFYCEKVSCRNLLLTVIAFTVATSLLAEVFAYFNYAIYVIIYLFGRFLSKSDAINTWKINAFKGYWIVTIIITLLVYLIYSFTPINNAESMSRFIFGYSYFGPLIILQAILLFIAFARMKISSKFINWCASSCFAIFLIHNHPSIKMIGYYSFTKKLYDMPLMEHMGILSILIISVFVGSILIDKIRIVISNSCYNSIMYIKSRINFKKIFIHDN